MQALSLGTTFSWPEASLLLIFLNLDISCSWQLIRLTSLFLKISFRWCFFVLASVSVNAFIVPSLFHGIYLFVMKYLSVSVKISSVDNSFLWHLSFFASLCLDISDTRVLHLRCASPATSSFRNSFTSVCSRYAFAYSRYVQQPSRCEFGSSARCGCISIWALFAFSLSGGTIWLSETSSSLASSLSYSWLNWPLRKDLDPHCWDQYPPLPVCHQAPSRQTTHLQVQCLERQRPSP